MERSRRIGTIALGAAAGLAALALVRRETGRRAADGFHGRVTLVTGGGRGLGFALARELAQRGALVTIAGRNAETLQRAGKRLADEGLAVETRRCDVRDAADVDALVASVEARHGAIDLLVNNAGVIEVGSIWDQDVDDFRESIDTHVFGPLHTMRAVLPSMRSRGAGSICNIASVGGLIAVPHLGPYSAGKFGLVGLSRAFAAEVAQDGITVTTVCPGLMRTGSPDNATFKGQTRKEYAWFTIGDANPLLSASSGHAVRAILAAVAQRKSFLTITPWARLAAIGAGVAPGLVAAALALTARLLPGPLGDPGVRRTGEQSHSAIAPSALTALDRLAYRENNE